MKQPLFTKICCDIFVIYFVPYIGQEKQWLFGAGVKIWHCFGYSLRRFCLYCNVDTCFVSLALGSGSVYLGGLAKHTNVTQQYLIAHKNLFTEKERQTMMNVFVESEIIALFKLISTLFHCDSDCESHNKVRMRYKK